MGALAVGRGLEVDFAAGALDDFLGEVQADAVVGRAFGGEEGFENAFAKFVGDAGAVVDDLNLAVGGSRDDFEGDGGIGNTGHGFDGVVDDVEDGAGEFVGDALPFAGFVDVGVEGDFVDDDLEVHNGREVLDHVSDGNGLGVFVVLGDEQEAAKFLAGALEGTVDDEEAVEDVFVEAIFHGEQLGAAEGGGERVVDFVREAGGELAEGFLPMLAEHALVQLVDGLLELDALFELVLKLFDAQGGSRAGEEFGLLDGFGKVVVSADFEAADFVFHLEFRGEEENGDVAGAFFGFEAFADFEAVHLRHHDVEDDDIDVFFGDDLKGGGTVGGNQAIEPGVLQADLKQTQRVPLVIHGEDARFAFGADDCFQIKRGGGAIGVDAGVHGTLQSNCSEPRRPLDFSATRNGLESFPMNDLLSQLKAHSTIVADTGDFASLRKYQPRDATTNPSLLLKAAEMPEYADLVARVLTEVRQSSAPAGQRIALALDRLAVAFGLEILKIVPNRVSTEVDARLSFDRTATLAKAREIIGMYDAAGISRERILVKIASTWEGIQAAGELKKEGINCNLTLLFSMAQAIACAEAGVQLISPFVGRILDWFKKSAGKESYPANEDPGVVSVTEIFHYYKKNGIATEVMGASFRNVGEILELAGCDLLTISPALLEEMSKTTGTVPRKLDAKESAAKGGAKVSLDEKAFRWMLNENQMATEKLSEGIRIFAADTRKLEKAIAAKLG